MLINKSHVFLATKLASQQPKQACTTTNMEMLSVMPREQSAAEQHNDKLPPSEATTCAGINFQLIEKKKKGAYKENDD